MSIPPPPQHPPPRRQPHEVEDPSLTTQIFLDQAKAATGGAPRGGATDGTPTGTSGTGAPQAPTPPEAPEESTQMMSMDELRALAAASHIDEIDGPREQGAAAQAPTATPHDDQRAQSVAPPAVFSPAVRPAAPSGPGVPPPPQAPPPHAQHAPQAAQSWQQTQAGAYGGHGAGTAAGAQASARKRGMPVLAIVFVVLSALIVLGIGGWILVDALTRTGDQQQTAPPAPPPATSSAPGGLVDGADDPTAEAGEDVESFTTPSGNIGCTIDAERARCLIAEHDFDAPEPPDGCTLDAWGTIVVGNSEGAGFSCTEAEFPTDGRTLDYGQTVSAHGMTCESSEEGVTCRSDETDASFSLARAGASFTQP